MFPTVASNGTKKGKPFEVTNDKGSTASDYIINTLPIPPTLKPNTKIRPCAKFLIAFAVLFVCFWIFIIFIVARRDKPLHFDAESFKENPLPVIDDNYYRDSEYSSLDTSASSAKVPKLLHQLWKDKEIPIEWLASHRSCSVLNPQYKLILWTDAMIYNFIYTHYPWFYKTFIGYPYHIQRVDVARYFILYHYGGVYLDIDATCKVPFDKITDQMANTENALIPKTDIHGVTNSFMAAKRYSDFFKYVMYELPSYAKGSYTLIRHTMIIFSTGPMFLSHCTETFERPDDIHVVSIEDYDEKYFTHAKGGTWHAADTEIIDIFHFHYIKVSLVFLTIVFLFSYYKYKKNYCCCQHS